MINRLMWRRCSGFEVVGWASVLLAACFRFDLDEVPADAGVQGGRGVKEEAGAVRPTPAMPDASMPEPGGVGMFEGVEVSLPVAAVKAGSTSACIDYQTTPEQICLGAAAEGPDCLTLSPSMQKGLVLWLDPTTLPDPALGDVDVWCDRSGHRNHALRALPTYLAPLRVTQDEVEGLDPSLSRSLSLDGNWMLINPDGDGVMFDGEDMSVFVGASVPRQEDLDLSPDSSRSITLFRALSFGVYDAAILVGYTSGSAPYALPTAAMWITQSYDQLVISPESEVPIYDGRLRLYGMRRAGRALQLRLNAEEVITSTDLPAIPTPPALISVSAIGSFDLDQSLASPARGRVRGVIAFNRVLDQFDLANLERFLCDRLDVCAALPAETTGSDAGVPM